MMGCVKYTAMMVAKTANCRNEDARRNQRRGSTCAATPCTPSTQQNMKTPAAAMVIQYTANQ